MKRYALWGIYLSIMFIALFSKAALETQMPRVSSKNPDLTPAQARYHSDSLKIYNLGFANLVSAVNWVELLQKSSHERVKEGSVSWEFAQVDAITQLDPGFDKAFTFGGIFLSVFKQDKLGAKIILDKWVKRQPHYWQPHYLLGYHLFYELQDYESGSREMLKAASMSGAPSWLSALGIRLLSETGSLAQALKLCVDIYPAVTSYGGKDRLKRRARSLNFALQKAAWEKALVQFRKEKNREPAELRELRPWLANQVREISSVFSGDPTNELAETLNEGFGFLYDSQQKKIRAQKTHRELDIDQVGIYDAAKTKGL